MHTLRAFEALARLGSFVAAADELALTASAVSHQIRSLESFYGVRLFTRSRAGVSPTPAGARLLEVIGVFLKQLQRVDARIRGDAGQRLSITLPPSLAARWFMPRVAAFLQARPTLDFGLHATTSVLDLDAQGIDFAIRFGNGQWPGVEAVKLMDERVFPVASPAHAALVPSRQRLLRDDFADWKDWFAQAADAVPALAVGPRFSDSALLLQAAEAGAGVALGRSVLVEDAITRGTLVRLGTGSLASAGAYYLVSSPGAPAGGVVAEFRGWLLDAVANRRVETA